MYERNKTWKPIYTQENKELKKDDTLCEMFIPQLKQELQEI